MPSGCFGGCAAATIARVCRIAYSPSPQSRKVPGVGAEAAAAAATEDQDLVATALGAMVQAAEDQVVEE